MRYGIEDRLVEHTPVYSYTEGPELAHGRIETRTYRVYDGLDIIADKKKWGGNMTIIEYESSTVKKCLRVAQLSEKTLVRQQVCPRILRSRLHRAQPLVDRRMHWGAGPAIFSRQYLKRKVGQEPPELDTIQRIVLLGFSILGKDFAKAIG